MYVNILNSVLVNDPDSNVYNADFHGNTIDSKYEDCVIYGRIGLAGENVSSVGSGRHCCDGLGSPNGSNLRRNNGRHPSPSTRIF